MCESVMRMLLVVTIHKNSTNEASAGSCAVKNAGACGGQEGAKDDASGGQEGAKDDAYGGHQVNRPGEVLLCVSLVRHALQIEEWGADCSSTLYNVVL